MIRGVTSPPMDTKQPLEGVPVAGPDLPMPLEGTRVVDLSHRVSGAYCTKLLVDAGAEVVKVEPPEGDPLRRWVTCGAVPAPKEAGALFHYLSASKQSVTADLESETARAVVRELAGVSDVVVETFVPGELERLGLGADALRRRRARLVVVSITDFGQDGPWAHRAATEFTLQGWCGSIGFRGTPDRPPLAAGGFIGEYLGGVVAATGALAALRSGGRDGEGGHVDVSLLECMTSGFQAFEWLHVKLMGLAGLDRSVELPSIERAKDGWVGFSMVTGQQWQDFCTMIGQPAKAEDPELRHMLGRWARREEVRSLVNPWVASRTVGEILDLAAALRIPAAPLGNGASMETIDHFRDRGIFLSNPAGFHQPRAPWLMSSARPRPVGRAPRLGEHAGTAFGVPRTGPDREGRTAHTSVAWDAGARPTARSRRDAGTAVPAGGPLTGLRVIDLTAFWAGPSATQVLAALGADVIKVESVQRPDGVRFAGGQVPGANRWWEHGWLFQGVNVNKRGITLDLTDDEGRDLVKRLVSGADVVIENFSPRVVEHLGLDFDDLSQVNPRLVMVRMPAFGLDGPWRDRVGFGPTMEQAAGMAWLTGYPDGPPVAPRGPSDPLAGYHAVFALLAALNLRDRTGTGVLVEVPMVEVALNVTADQVAEYALYGRLLERQGNRGPGAAPQNVYPTRGEDRWLALAVVTDEQWDALCSVMGDPDWARDLRLRSAAGRVADHDRIDEELRSWFQDQDREEVVERLAKARVPAAPVVSPADVVDNPQLRAREFFQTVRHDVTGANAYARPPFRLGEGPRVLRPAPTLGQHNYEVLVGELGISENQLERLRSRRIVGERPEGL